MDLHNLSDDSFDATELVSLLTDCDLVTAEWPEVSTRRGILKGLGLLEHIRSAVKAVDVQVCHLNLANETQVKLLETALILIEVGEMDTIETARLSTLLVAASCGGELH